MDSKIETSRLTLRPWDEADIDHLTLGLNDLKLSQWLAFVPHPYSTSDAENWIKRCQALSSAAGSARAIARDGASHSPRVR